MRDGLRAAGLAVVIAAFAAGAARSDAAVTSPTRVTVFGDSAATAMAYDPGAKRTLGRGVDLRLEVAACRRLGDLSCPYDGVRPPNVIDRATTLGVELGPVVVVAVGYNDYEANYAKNIDDAMAVFRKAGVQHVLWATLRAGRQSYVDMNGMIVAAAKRYPEMTVLDWDGLARGKPGHRATERLAAELDDHCLGGLVVPIARKQVAERDRSVVCRRRSRHRLATSSGDRSSPASRWLATTRGRAAAWREPRRVRIASRPSLASRASLTCRAPPARTRGGPR